MNTTRRPVATLRARWPMFGPQPQPGILLATPTGPTVYRVLAVDRITDATTAYRYRLRCARMTRAEVPDCIPIGLWKWDARGRRPRARLCA